MRLLGLRCGLGGRRIASRLQRILRRSSQEDRGFSSIAIHSKLERVGFIGLGNMGFYMANNLINAGYKVTVHDINSIAMRKFSEKGITTKEAPHEVAESSDVIITMLPSSSSVMEVYTGKNGLLNAGNRLRPWLFIDASTIDPQTSRMLFKKISEYQMDNKGESSHSRYLTLRRAVDFEENRNKLTLPQYLSDQDSL